MRGEAGECKAGQRGYWHAHYPTNDIMRGWLPLTIHNFRSGTRINGDDNLRGRRIRISGSRSGGGAVVLPECGMLDGADCG